MGEQLAIDHAIARAACAAPARLVFLMLNPSTADAERDDPTVRKVLGFAERWGFGYLEGKSAEISPDQRYRYTLRRGCLGIVNMFAWRATDPSELRAAAARGEDLVGPHNDSVIERAVRNAEKVVIAWGAKSWGFVQRRRLEIVRVHLGFYPRKLYRLERCYHPLMLSYETPLERFTWSDV